MKFSLFVIAALAAVALRAQHTEPPDPPAATSFQLGIHVKFAPMTTGTWRTTARPRRDWITGSVFRLILIARPVNPAHTAASHPTVSSHRVWSIPSVASRTNWIIPHVNLENPVHSAATIRIVSSQRDWITQSVVVINANREYCRLYSIIINRFRYEIPNTRRAYFSSPYIYIEA